MKTINFVIVIFLIAGSIAYGQNKKIKINQKKTPTSVKTLSAEEEKHKNDSLLGLAVSTPAEGDLSVPASVYILKKIETLEKQVHMQDSLLTIANGKINDYAKVESDVNIIRGQNNTLTDDMTATKGRLNALEDQDKKFKRDLEGKKDKKEKKKKEENTDSKKKKKHWYFLWLF